MMRRESTARRPSAPLGSPPSRPAPPATDSATVTDPPPDYRRRLEADFDLPPDAPLDLRFVAAPGELGRRDFVRLLGASLALAGLTGCVRRPRESILPYVTRPSSATPTAARHYATSMMLDGYATGLL